jgi:hypothetical protein
LPTPQLDDVCLDGESSVFEFGVQAARVGEGVGEEDLAIPRRAYAGNRSRRSP